MTRAKFINSILRIRPNVLAVHVGSFLKVG